MIELFILSYLYNCLLNYKICLHHKIVLYLYIIVGCIYKIILLVFESSNLNDGKKDDTEITRIWLISGILFYFFIMILRIIVISNLKILMDIYYISPTKLLMFYGIIGSLISFSICIISYNIVCNGKLFIMHLCNIKISEDTYLENYHKYFEDIKGNFLWESFTVIVGLIVNFFYMLNYFLIIKFLTPMHIIFMNLIYMFFLKIFSIIYNLIVGKNGEMNWVCYLKIISYIFIAFGLFVYLEIIVLNFCGINYNLRQNIIIRGIKDYRNFKNTKSSIETQEGIEDQDENEDEKEHISGYESMQNESQRNNKNMSISDNSINYDINNKNNLIHNSDYSK